MIRDFIISIAIVGGIGYLYTILFQDLTFIGFALFFTILILDIIMQLVYNKYINKRKED